jgi:hypothetical protein
MAAKNFGLKHADFPGGEDPNKITNLKSASQQ